MSTEPKRLLTYEDYATFPYDGVRREIVGGVAYEPPAPYIRHQRVVSRLFFAFEEHLRRRGGGEVLVSPVDVLLSEHDIVQPDVVFVASDREEIVTEPNIVGAPTLVIEVLSDPRHDLVRKRALYAAAGVPEYWIADPDSDRVEVYRLGRRGYGKPAIFEPPDGLTFAQLPGLEIDLTDLFRR